MEKIPQQSIPHSQKDKAWREATVEGYIEQASFEMGSNSKRNWLMKLYDYYNGKIDRSDYEYVLQPYGKERKNFPAKIRNYPLIKPSIDLLIGEKAKRPFNFTVVVESDDVETVKSKIKQKRINENLQQWFVNKLNDAGFDTGQESQEVDLPGDVERSFERNWRDNRAVMAHRALEYLIPYLKYQDKVQKAWFDFLVSGYCFTHRGVRNGDPFYEVLNPLDVDYDKDPNVDFVEDGNWAVIRQLVSRSSVIDHFQGQLSDAQVKRLENPRNSNRDVFFWYNQDENTFFDDWDNYTELCTVYWKSLRKVGFRTYVDEFGEEYEEVVEEDYEFNPETDIDLEWEWINEVWQGYRIDGDMYMDVKPYVHQRANIDNPSQCRLPVNGRAYSDRNSENISLVELGIAYQLSYNIFKYRLENAIAKSKDILALLDVNIIPDGWSMDKFMHILESTGIGWVDYNSEGVKLNPQHQSAIDMSIKTIQQYVELLRYIKEEWEYVSGISRQRMGETGQYEGKAVTEQAIMQSSHITEDYYRKFSALEQRDMQAFIDYAQIAWLDGKKSNYVAPNGTTQMLDIDPEDFVNEEFGVFVKDANKEKQKLDQLKGLAQAGLQNGVPMSIIAEVMDSENFAEIKSKIDEAEQMMQRMEQEAQKVEQEMKQAEMQDKQAERDLERENNIRDNETKIEVELIKQQMDETEDEEWKKELEERKIELENEIKREELNEERRSNRNQERIKEKEVQAKKQSSSQS